MDVLDARSPDFMAMFQSNMKEKQTNTVNIDDCRAGIVDKMLNFIYTGNVSSPDTISGIISELFKAADKYQLDLIKDFSEESLCSNLKVNNCLEYLVLGDMHDTSVHLKSRKLLTVHLHHPHVATDLS